MRNEANLGQAPLNRHLAALEAHFVVPAGTGGLSLVTSAAGLALARRTPSSHALPTLREPGLRVLSFIMLAVVMFYMPLVLNLLNEQQVSYLIDHAPVLWCVIHYNRLVHPA